MKFVTLSGLPRSGSTLLGNLLQQHPDITVEMDSCLSNILTNISQHSEKMYSETQHTMEEMKTLYYSFMRAGISSWLENLCQTNIYVDKDRSWSVDFDLLFNLVPTAKVIYIVRDLRGVISSLEKMETQNRVMSPSTQELYPFETREEYHNVDLMDKRIESYMNGDMLYTPLFALKEILDCERRYLNNFKFVRYEDLMENPQETISKIYRFIGCDNHANDLDNVKQRCHHDSIYAPWGNHTIRPKVVSKKETYEFPLIKRKSQHKILRDYSWYYQYFYPNLK